MRRSNWHLIAYDIKNTKRLAKVHRVLQKMALPIQRSVFLILANDQRLENILDQITTIINTKEDDIRTYPIHSAQTIWLEGQSPHPNLFINQPPLQKTWNHTYKWLKQKYPTRSAPYEAEEK